MQCRRRRRCRLSCCRPAAAHERQPRLPPLNHILSRSWVEVNFVRSARAAHAWRRTRNALLCRYCRAAAISRCGGAAGLPSLAALPPLLPRLAVLWQMSAQRKRQEEAERMEAGASSSGRQGLQAAPSGKGCLTKRRRRLPRDGSSSACRPLGLADAKRSQCHLSHALPLQSWYATVQFSSHGVHFYTKQASSCSCHTSSRASSSSSGGGGVASASSSMLRGGEWGAADVGLAHGAWWCVSVLPW